MKLGWIIAIIKIRVPGFNAGGGEQARVRSWGRSLNSHHTMLDLCGHGLEHCQHSLLELGIENRGSCRLGLWAKGWDGVHGANDVMVSACSGKCGGTSCMSSSMTEVKEGLGVSIGVEPSKSYLISSLEMVADCSTLGGIRERTAWTQHFNQVILFRLGLGPGDLVGRRFTVGQVNQLE